MKTKITTVRGMLLVGFAGLLVACSDRGVQRLTEQELQGTLALTLRADTTVTLMTTATDAATKGGWVDAAGELDFGQLPVPADFRVRITTAAGEVVREWDSFADMPPAVRLKEGDYRLTASYGADRQGGAFEQLRLQGATDFRVERQKTIPVSVVCRVADVLLTADYTEGFQNYFKDHSLTVYADGQTFAFARGETRVACFNPGDLSTVLNLTREYDGQVYTLPGPTLSGAKAGEYYRLKIDVGEDGAGGAHLLLTFNEATEQEPIRVELSAEALAGPFYTTSADFVSGDTIRLGEGQAYENDLSALVTARAVIASCVVSTTSPELRAKGWPQAGYELVGIGQADKDALKAFGFQWTEGLAGLNMAVLNFKGLTGQMPAGDTESKSHQISVVTTDRDGKQSDPLTLVFQIIPPQFEITGYVLQPSALKANNTTYYVEVIGGNPDKIFFEYYNPVWNHWNRISSNRGNYTNGRGWRFTVTDIDWSWASVRLRVGYEGREGHYAEKEIQGKLVNPTGTVTEQWSYTAVFRATQTSADAKYYNPSHYTVQISADGGATWDQTKPYTVYLDYIYSSQYVHFAVSDLEPGTTYKARVTYDPKIGLTPTTGDYTINTEAVVQLPNGDFEQGWNNTVWLGVQMGGRRASQNFWGSTTWYTASTSVTNYRVDGWASVNDKTIPNKDWLSANGRTVNSWYMAESMISTAGYSGMGVLVRNVSWNNQGANPPDNTSVWNSDPGTPNAPDDGQFRAAVGKLFLSWDGYSYDHQTNTEVYNAWIPFTSRPMKLKGYYKYTPMGDDRGVVEISVVNYSAVLNRETVLATNRVILDQAGDWTSFEVPLTYTTNTKANRIRVMFASSDKASEDHTVEETAGITTSHNNFSRYYKGGSELYIDEISLEYQ